MNKFEELGKAIDEEFDIQREMIYRLYDELNKQKNKNLDLAAALRNIADILESDD